MAEVINKALEGLAKAIFQKTKISIEAAAQSVVPSIPKYLASITKEITTGPAENITEILNHLDKTVRSLGIDLGKYSKGLEDFSNTWREKQTAAEQEVAELKQNNIIAEVNRYNEVNILSKREISTKYKELDLINIDLKKEKELFEIEKKLLQSKKQTLAQEDKLKRSLRDRSKNIQSLEKDREATIQTLGPEAEDRKPGMFSRMGARFRGAQQSASNFAERYLPSPIRDLASGFTDQLAIPFNTVKEFGSQIADLAKPLRLIGDPIKKLGRGFGDMSKNFFNFGGEFGKTNKNLKGFSGMTKNVTGLFNKLGAGMRIFGLGLLKIIMNPVFLAIAGIAAAAGIVAFLLNKYGKPGGPGSAGDMAGETHLDDDPELFKDAAPTRDPMAPGPVVDPDTKEIIQPEDPRFEDTRKKVLGDDYEKFKNPKKIQSLTPEMIEDQRMSDIFKLRGGGIDLEQFKKQIKDSPMEMMASSKTQLINNQPITNVKNGSTQISTGITGSRNDDLWLNRGMAV